MWRLWWMLLVWIMLASAAQGQSRDDDEPRRVGVGVSTGNAAVDAALGASLEPGAASASARSAQRVALLRAADQASAASAPASPQDSLRDALLREAAVLAAGQKAATAQPDPEHLPPVRRVDTSQPLAGDGAAGERWRGEVKSIAALLREYREWLLAGVLAVSGIVAVVSLSRSLSRGGSGRSGAPVPPAPRSPPRERRRSSRR